MPKRVLDFDALWGSDKLASCADWAQAEYAWLYGLADASGCFELSNLRVIWGRVAAIRRNLSIERLEQVFNEFQDKGLLFVWEHEGKRYGHWTGSDVPGRLPPPSWRMRLERLAPPVPKQKLVEYMSRYSRGRAALAGGGFGVADSQTQQPCAPSGSGEPYARDISRRTVSANCGEHNGCLERELDQGLKRGVEAGQAQDWNLNLDLNRNLEKEKNSLRVGPESGLDARRKMAGNANQEQRQEPVYVNTNSRTNSNSRANSGLNARTSPDLSADAHSDAYSSRVTEEQFGRGAAAGASWTRASAASAKEAYLLSELRVGQGPSCGPIRVRPEVLERIRARDAARKGSRSP